MYVIYFSATVRLPADKFTSSDSKKQDGGAGTSAQDLSAAEMKKIILNSSEDLYSDLRDKNFNAVGPTLSRRAKMLTTEFDVRLSMECDCDSKIYCLGHMSSLHITAFSFS